METIKYNSEEKLKTFTTLLPISLQKALDSHIKITDEKKKTVVRKALEKYLEEQAKN